MPRTPTTVMIVEYDDLKLDLSTALSLLEQELTDAEAWEVYARIELGAYKEALVQLQELATSRDVQDAIEFLHEVARRVSVAGDEK
jgi:hypothetical protein